MERLKIIGMCLTEFINKAIIFVKTGIISKYISDAEKKVKNTETGIGIPGIILFPVLITVLFKQNELTTISLLTVLFISLSDPGRSYQMRIRTMISGACLMITAFASACLVYNKPVIAVGFIFLWSFSAGMLNIAGGTGMRLGPIAVISFIMFSAIPSGTSVFLPGSLIIVSGTVLVAGIRLWKWPLQPYQPLYNAVADYYRALNPLFYCTSVDEFLITENGTDESSVKKSIEIQRAHDIAYMMLRDMKNNYNQIIRKMHLLLQKADLLAITQIAFSESLRNVSSGSNNDFIKETTCRIIGVAAQLQNKIKESIKNGGITGSLTGADVTAQVLISDTKSLSENLNGVDDYTVSLEIIYCIEILEQYIAILLDVCNIIGGLNHQKPVKGRKTAVKNPVVSNIQKLIAGHITLQSPVLCHSLRLSLTLAIATAIELFLKIPHGYWIPLTAAIILKPDFSDTRQRVLTRIGGTVGGCFLALLLTSFIHNRLIILFLVIVLFYLAFSYRSQNYGIYVFFWTPVIILLLEFNDNGTSGIAMERMLNSFAGGALAVAAICLVFPQWESIRLRGFIVKTLSSNRHYGHAVLGIYTGRTELLPDIEPLRQQTNRDCNNALSSLMRLNNEPGSRKGDIIKLLELVMHNRQLCNILTALSVGKSQLKDDSAVPGMQLLSREYNTILQKIETSAGTCSVQESLSRLNKNVALIQDEISTIINAHLNQKKNLSSDRYFRDMLKVCIPLKLYLPALYRSIEGLKITEGGAAL